MESLTLLYDGCCRLCLRTVATLRRLRLRVRLVPVPLQEARPEQLPPGVSREELLAELHAVDASGRLYRGADAVLRILREVRGLGWLAALGRLPLLAPAVDAAYRWLARHRYRLFGTVEDCADGSCGLHGRGTKEGK